MTPIRVLGIDDNELIGETFARVFAEEPGFTWVGTRSTAEGLLQAVQDTAADVVLLDLDMPGPDPITALQDLTLNAPDVRVIVLSGHVRRDLIDRAIEAGAYGYLSKNDDGEVLLESIRAVSRGEFVLGQGSASELRLE